MLAGPLHEQIVSYVRMHLWYDGIFYIL
jgi:hypothetical protein